MVHIYDTKGKRWLCDIEVDDFKNAMHLYRKLLVQKSGIMVHGFSCYLPEEPNRYRCVRPEDINLSMTLDMVKGVSLVSREYILKDEGNK